MHGERWWAREWIMFKAEFYNPEPWAANSITGAVSFAYATGERERFDYIAGAISDA